MPSTALALVLLFISFVLSAAIEGHYWQSSLISVAVMVVHTLAISCLLVWWASQDARSKGCRLTTTHRILIFLLGFLSLPVYLWRTRSGKNLALSLIASGAFIAGLFFVDYFVYTYVPDSYGA
jgi:hypothetical protein